MISELKRETERSSLEGNRKTFISGEPKNPSQYGAEVKIFIFHFHFSDVIKDVVITSRNPKLFLEHILAPYLSALISVLVTPPGLL